MICFKSRTLNLKSYNAILSEYVFTLNDYFIVFCLIFIIFTSFLAFICRLHNFNMILGLAVLYNAKETILSRFFFRYFSRPIPYSFCVTIIFPHFFLFRLDYFCLFPPPSPPIFSGQTMTTVSVLFVFPPCFLYVF